MATQTQNLSMVRYKHYNGNWTDWTDIGSNTDGYAGGNTSAQYSSAVQFTVPQTTGSAGGRTLKFSMWLLGGYYTSTTLRYAITKSAPKDGQLTPNGTVVVSGTFSVSGLTVEYKNTTLTISNVSLPLSGGTYYLYLYDGNWCQFGNQSSYHISGTMSYSPYSVEATTGWTISSTSVTLGNSLTITMPSATEGNSSNVHILYYRTSGGQEGRIAGNVKFNSTYTWSPPLSFANAVPSATSMTCTVSCLTLKSDGTTLIGTTSKNITLTVPTSVVPSFTISQVKANDKGKNGLFVRGVSSMTVSLASISGSYGSSVRSYRIRIGDTSGSVQWSSSGTISGTTKSITTPVLNVGFTSASATSETKRVTIIVTDSRNRTATHSQNFTYYAYTSPLITSFEAYRVAASGDTQQNSSGTWLRVYLKTNSITSLGGKNARSSSLTYSPAVTGTASNPSAAYSSSGYTAWFDISGINKTISITYSYADDYRSTKSTVTVATASVPLDIGFSGTGIGLGRLSSAPNSVDIGFDTRIRQDLRVDGALTVVSDAELRQGLTVKGNLTAANSYQIQYKTIPDGANLNSSTYKVPGYYRSLSSSNTITNVPDTLGSGAFELIVTGISDSTYCTQRIKAFHNDREWVRTQTNYQDPWTWTGWKEEVRYTNASGSGIALNSAAKADVQAGISFYRACSSNNSNVKRTFVFEASGDLPELSLWQTTPGGTTATVLNCGFNAGNGYLYPGNTEVDIGKTSKYFRNGYFTNLYASSLGWKTLYSGTLKSGTATLTNGAKYAALVVYGKPSSSSDYVALVIPPGDIGRCQLTDNEDYLTFTPKQSGDNITITVNSAPSSGYISSVWGLVRATV